MWRGVMRHVAPSRCGCQVTLLLTRRRDRPRSLKALNTGTVVNRISSNYVNWQSSPPPVIVGHIVVPGGAELRIRTPLSSDAQTVVHLGT